MEIIEVKAAIQAMIKEEIAYNVSELEKWNGTTTTWGDTQRNAADVNFGAITALENIESRLSKYLTKKVRE